MHRPSALAVLGLAASTTAIPPPPTPVSRSIGLRRRHASFVRPRQCCLPRCRTAHLRPDGGTETKLSLPAWSPWGGGGDRGGELNVESATPNGGTRKSSSIGNNEPPLPSELRRVELEVEAEARERLDRRRIAEALHDDTDNSGSGSGSNSNDPGPAKTWNVALAAGGTAAGLAFLAFHSWFLSSTIFAAVSYLATRDPLEEEDGIAGALARILGRWTLRSVDTATPKVKAAIRAAATGEEEVAALRARIRELEVENETLRVWARRRRAVDENASQFTLDDLKFMAKARGVPYSGRTKAQLMMALLEEGALDL